MGIKEIEEIFKKYKVGYGIRQTTLLKDYKYSNRSFQRSIKNLIKSKYVIKYVPITNTKKVYYVWIGD